MATQGRGLGWVAAVVAVCALGWVTAAATGTDPEPATPVQDEGFRFEHWPPGPAAQRGRAVYESHCIGCHGQQGQADGPAVRWLDPIPRDFQAGNFKFRSTPSGELPTDDDLAHVVRCGLQGSSMPAFPLMAQSQLLDVVAYVRYLIDFGVLKSEVEYVMDDDGVTLDAVLADDFDALVAEALGDAYEEVWPVSVDLAPESDEDSVARGRTLYEAQCVACHGQTGQGDGPSSFHLRDWKDARVVPRDLTTGVFRAGSSPRDLFLRLRCGVNGTPMPSIYGSDEELWAIVDYILSLGAASTRVEPHPTSCAAHAREAATR